MFIAAQGRTSTIQYVTCIIIQPSLLQVFSVPWYTMQPIRQILSCERYRKDGLLTRPTKRRNPYAIRLPGTSSPVLYPKVDYSRFKWTDYQNYLQKGGIFNSTHIQIFRRSYMYCFNRWKRQKILWHSKWNVRYCQERYTRRAVYRKSHSQLLCEYKLCKNLSGRYS